MNEIILATFNKNKTKEFQQIFGGKIIIKNLHDINFNEEIIENGKTFIENSIIKCEKVFEKVNAPVMADDSGLCVKQLKGAPGVLSARYGGQDLTDKERCDRLLRDMKKDDSLDASFVCALVLFINPNNIYVAQEEVKGVITFTPLGGNGFGYDPVFFLPQFNKTMAELSDSEKNSISHRGKAARMMSAIIEKVFK